MRGMEQVLLNTKRLLLRPLSELDCELIQSYCSEKELASTTLSIPHPYTLKDAEEWIVQLQKDSGPSVVWGMVFEATLIGVISLVIRQVYDSAELAFWVGRPYWRKGFCTEASKEVIKYGFQKRCLNKIFAYHMTRNPASGKVIKKIGMQFEGILRQHVKKWGQYEDLASYSMLRSEYESSH